MSEQRIDVLKSVDKEIIYIYPNNRWRDFLIQSAVLFLLLTFVFYKIAVSHSAEQGALGHYIMFGFILVLLSIFPLLSLVTILLPIQVIVYDDMVTTKRFGKSKSYAASKIKNMRYELVRVVTARSNRQIPSITFLYQNNRTVQLASYVSQEAAKKLLQGSLKRFI